MSEVAPNRRRYLLGRFGCLLWAVVFVVLLMALAELVSEKIGFRPAISDGAPTSN
jgi:hypothetical protein